jgi:hypothetical protein
MSNELEWHFERGLLVSHSASGCGLFSYRAQWEDTPEGNRLAHAYITSPQDATFGSYPTLDDAMRACQSHHDAICAAIEEAAPKWVDSEILSWEGYVFKIVASPKINLVTEPPKEQSK